MGTIIFDKENTKMGIYGVYSKEDNLLLYIGQTKINFSQRWNSHLESLLKPYPARGTNRTIWEYFNNDKTIEFKEILAVEAGSLQFEKMYLLEFYYMWILKPIGNITKRGFTSAELADIELNILKNKTVAEEWVSW